MSLPVGERRDAIRKRIDTAFPFSLGYGSFRVELSRPRKGEPRVVKVSWMVYPFEAQVAEALGDLMSEDVTFDRNLLWSCGNLHPDSMDAWKDHEGNHYLDYPDDGYGNYCYEAGMELPDDVEAELREGGEEFESSCVPGNYVRCPTCDGGARYMPDRKALRFEPCPDCVRLGTDRGAFLGILNLDTPAHRDFYDAGIAARRTNEAHKAAVAETKRAKALAVPAATAKPVWVALPSRAGGILNNITIPESAPGCDYLAQADSPSLRSRCSNDAKWFEPTTGLRVCTRHRSAGTAGG